MKQKFALACISGILFIILSLPATFIFTNKLFHSVVQTTFDDCPGLPTLNGSTLHALLYAIIMFIILTMQRKPPGSSIHIRSNNNDLSF